MKNIPHKTSSATSEPPFVPENSLVREIWSNSDHILLVFAGSAAEFALHKQVDWLYYTGKLPQDPIKRLFSTVEYAAKIVFSTKVQANHAIDQINQIHQHVEKSRGSKIPNWAYLDVLSMLIAYSIKSYEIWKRPLSLEEKEEIYGVFLNIALRMELSDMPGTYINWESQRQANWENNYTYSRYTKNLFQQYQKHLGWFRFWLLLQVHEALLDAPLKKMLGFKRQILAWPLIGAYKLLRMLNLAHIPKSLLIPKDFKKDFEKLDRPNPLNLNFASH